MSASNSPFSLLTLTTVRGFIARSGAIMMTFCFTIVYALASMLIGGMIVLGSIPGGYTVEILTRSAAFEPVWEYPGLLIVAPWGVVSLPWFPTLAMILVSVGVGIGMSVAVLLVLAIVRASRRETGRPAGAASVAGFTPALISLVTLGACCSTTAAASAGVAVVAALSGTSAAALILNNWYLGVFQIVVVWAALVAQELLLRVYGVIFGLPAPASSPSRPASARPLDRRFLGGTLLRMALLAGGVTWSLAMVAEWTTQNPLAAPGAVWFRWIFEHQVVAFLAMFAAFAPAGTYRGILGIYASRFGALLRTAFAVGGLALLVWAPPPAAGWGIEGLGNELAFVFGAPASWGAVAPVFAPGLSLYLRWGLQYLLLAIFALWVAVAPEAPFRPLRWSVGHPLEDSGAEPVSGGLPATAATGAVGPVATGPSPVPTGSGSPVSDAP